MHASPWTRLTDSPPASYTFHPQLRDIFCRLPVDEERELQGVLASAKARQAYRKQAGGDDGEEGEEEEEEEQEQKLLGDVEECREWAVRDCVFVWEAG